MKEMPALKNADINFNSPLLLKVSNFLTQKEKPMRFYYFVPNAFIAEWH